MAVYRSLYLLPLTTIGDTIPLVAAFLGIVLCVSVSSLPDMKPPTKLLFCFGIVAFAWGMVYLFMFALSILLY
jgi:hypothetical protein